MLVDHFPMKIAIYIILLVVYYIGIYWVYILFSDKPMMIHQWIQVTVREVVQLGVLVG